MRYRRSLVSFLLAWRTAQSETCPVPLTWPCFPLEPSSALLPAKTSGARSLILAGFWDSGQPPNAAGAHRTMFLLVTTLHIPGLESLMSLWCLSPGHRGPCWQHHSFKAESSLPASFPPLIGWPLLPSTGLWVRKRSGLFHGCSFQLTFWCSQAGVSCPSSVGDAQHAIELEGAQEAKQSSWEEPDLLTLVLHGRRRNALSTFCQKGRDIITVKQLHFLSSAALSSSQLCYLLGLIHASDVGVPSFCRTENCIHYPQNMPAKE